MPVPFVHDDDDLLPPPGGDVDDHVDLLPIAGTGRWVRLYNAAEPAQRKQAASRKRRAQVDSAATLPNGRIRPQVDSAATLPNATIRRNLEDRSFCTLAPPENRERFGRSAYDRRAFVLGTTSSFAPGAMRTASAFVERRNAVSSAPVFAAMEARLRWEQTTSSRRAQSTTTTTQLHLPSGRRLLGLLSNDEHELLIHEFGREIIESLEDLDT